MKRYKLKLTAITPIHIGTGEDYEPTNFVIDGGYLYEFDEYKFYDKLDDRTKQLFLQAVESKLSDSLFARHRVIKLNKQKAIECAISKVKVSKGIESYYQNRVGKAVQNEGGKKVKPSKVFNRFQIARTIRQPNSQKVYIPGSSIKGAFSTAYQEKIYKQNPTLWRECFEKPLDNIFKNILVSDTNVLKSSAKVGYVLNKERFEEEPLGPSNKMEVIEVGSTFETIVSFRNYKTPKRVDFDFLKDACDKHYLKLFQQSFKPFTIFKGKKVDDFTNEYFPESFYEKYKDFQPKENQFIIRVGKHSGARAVTIEGIRKIKVRESKYKTKILDQETTTWMFGEKERDEKNLLPIGWVLCEIV